MGKASKLKAGKNASATSSTVPKQNTKHKREVEEQVSCLTSNSVGTRPKATQSWASIAASGNRGTNVNKKAIPIGRNPAASSSQTSTNNKNIVVANQKAGYGKKKPKPSNASSLFDFISQPKTKLKTSQHTSLKYQSKPKTNHSLDSKKIKIITDKSKEVGLRKRGEKKKHLSTLKKKVLRERKLRAYLEHPEIAPYPLQLHPSLLGFIALDAKVIHELKVTERNGKELTKISGAVVNQSDNEYGEPVKLHIPNPSSEHPVFFFKSYGRETPGQSGLITCEDISTKLNSLNEEARSTNRSDLSKRKGSVSESGIIKIANVYNIREYVTQALDHNLDEVVSEMVKKLFELQRRQYLKDPLKAKARRRLVMGMREVRRGVKSGNLKCIIVASNIDQGSGGVIRGGLDDNVRTILDLCEPTAEELELGKDPIPVIFALNKSKLGEAVGKRIKISTIGIQSVDGAYEEYRKAVSLAQSRKLIWNELIQKEAITKNWVRCKKCALIMEHTYYYCTDCKNAWCSRCNRSNIDTNVPCDFKTQEQQYKKELKVRKKKPKKTNGRTPEECTPINKDDSNTEAQDKNVDAIGCQGTIVRIARTIPRSVFMNSEEVSADQASASVRKQQIRGTTGKTLNANAREFVPQGT